MHGSRMRGNLRPLLLALTFIVVAATITACNIQGFFTKLGDDPTWVDPNAATATAADAGAGGPGKAVYGKICASCHLGTGKGVPANNIPPLAGSAYAQGDATVPIRIVLHGFKGPIQRGGVTINGQMAAWKDVLSDQEISDVLTYVRSSFGNAGAAVTVDEVKAAREKTTGRAGAFTEAELEQPL
ncbi:hypothetical protein BH10BAC6_BH10BAC6_10660 [soil metagenome]